MLLAISCIYIYLKKKGLFLQENNESIFVKIRSKFDKGLNFRNLAFEISFTQITH